jgi:hypothetical protein
MSAPNILNVTSITGKSFYLALSDTNATELISNPASSDKVIKINMIQIANVDPALGCNVTVDYHDAASIGGTPYSLVANLNVPAKASIVALDKNTSLYLEEDRSISVTAETSDHLEVIISYEEIS